MSKKKLLKVFRETGRALKKENIELALADFRVFYDLVIAKYIPDPSKLPSKEQADKANVALSRFERRLNRKYPTVEYWPFMSSQLQLKKKIKEIGFPIAIGMEQNTGELVYMICDKVQE